MERSVKYFIFTTYTFQSYFQQYYAHGNNCSVAGIWTFGVYNFGMDALLMLIVTTATAVLTEFIYEKLMHKKITIGDFSAVVTGLLLGLNMPPYSTVVDGSTW